jgi:hypothetical protein
LDAKLDGVDLGAGINFTAYPVAGQNAEPIRFGCRIDQDLIPVSFFQGDLDEIWIESGFDGVDTPLRPCAWPRLTPPRTRSCCCTATA